MHVGNKIKEYRIRAGLSQMDAELRLGMAPGSLSRIENGKVNPTKETLLQMSEFFSLNAIETADLLGVEIGGFTSLIKLAGNLSQASDIDELLQNAVNDIALELNLLIAGTALVKDKRVYSYTLTETWYTKLITKMLPLPVKQIAFPLEPDSPNVVVQAILREEVMHASSVSDFLVPVIPKQIADQIQRLIGLRSAIIFPLMIGDNAQGAVVFAKDTQDDFMKEYKILQEFAEIISKILSKRN
jgi:transcriptional regulator with XRE-family HTH domain